MTPTYLAFWGKSRDDAGSLASFHPVLCHLLDVAAVTGALLAVRPRLLSRASSLLLLDREACQRLLVALAAFHDLGKFAPAFQAKVPRHWPTELLGPLDPHGFAASRHTDDGYRLWHHALAAEIGDRIWLGGRDALHALAPAIFGHHGRPISPTQLREQPAAWPFGKIALPIALQCASDLVDLLQPAPLTALPVATDRAIIAGWWISGLITVADWIGSRERWFTYAGNDEHFDLASYWRCAQLRAHEAVRAEGLAPPLVAPERSFAELTASNFSPSPAQSWATNVELPMIPTLVIIEDVTGAGKTEAAQMLVHRMMRAGQAGGAYWAMPTQATANAMYGRQAEALDALFARVTEGSVNKPSLVLSHGQTRLHDTFRATVLRPSFAEAESDSLRRDVDPPSGVLCAEFFANDRRTAFLADVGAGTIDQALLGVLPSRFNTMRLFGLSDKILIVDEAHAYDAYMSAELDELLCFHAALGGSAIVLSATLPQKKRQDLISAWQKGLNAGRRPPPPRPGTKPDTGPTVLDTAYPLATMVWGSGDTVRVCETPVAAASWSNREVPVRFVDSVEAVIAPLVDGVENGAAVVWIRNTVRDCLAGAALLRARGLNPLVFHARFAQCDRQQRESEVLHLFGLKASNDERRGRMLVATQVVEQSLDLDFDVMVSDIAPVDLLIQRAGRLWRHESRDAARPAGSSCELVVLAPAFEAEPDAKWMSGFLPGTNAVYEDTGVLWRTVRALTDNGQIATPAGLRPLIEAVYGCDDVPPALEAAANRAHGREFGAGSVGRQVVLDITAGYRGDGKSWVDDMRVPTRLGGAQITLRLARFAADGGLVPWAGTVDGSLWKEWALSEVRVSAGKVPPGCTPQGVSEEAIAATRQPWNRFEQEIPIVPLLEGEDGVWRATLVRPRGEVPIQITYTSTYGIDFG